MKRPLHSGRFCVWRYLLRASLDDLVAAAVLFGPCVPMPHLGSHVCDDGLNTEVKPFGFGRSRYWRWLRASDADLVAAAGCPGIIFLKHIT